MVLNERPSKRARRNRVTAHLDDVLTFPEKEETSALPFRESVKVFLSRHARVTFPPSVFPSTVTWQILLRVGDLVEGPDLSPVVVSLNIVEEDVTRSTRSVYCNQCRVVGWSGHPVCRKRYHFIIRADDNRAAVEGYDKCCSRCGNLLLSSESLPDSKSRCKRCDSLIACDDPEPDPEDWVYSLLEDNNNLLHGVVHSNGFAHLLRVNGREGGSKFLSGSDIMNFWDRLCNTLAVRKVSVMDVSRKYGVEYRLLHAITKGHSWYGDWGYEFGCGSYALTLDAYMKAVKTLSDVPLAPLLFQRRRLRTCLQAVIAFYQSLSDSELLTLKDLFTFLLRLLQDNNKQVLPKATPKNSESSTSNVLCAWTRNDVENVQQAMIKILVTASGKTNWVTRHALKGVMCKTASPELLDYCLKHFKGKLAATGMVVQARCNPDSGDSEFRVEQLSFMHYGDGLDANHPSKEDIKRHLKFLFDSLLHPKTMVKYGPELTRESIVESATKLLDCKQFMKDYQQDKNIISNPAAIHLWCHLKLRDEPKEYPAIPPELIVLPSQATITDLKNEATKAFEEVYAMFKKLEANELLEYASVEDSITLKLLVGLSGSVGIKGTCLCLSKHGANHFRMERGTENWTVDCMCGVKDDDGEPMLACDTCGVWQHTRCAGIDISDAVPATFLCMRCIPQKRSKKVPKSKEVIDEVSLPRISTCRELAGGIGTELTTTFSVR